MWLLFKPDTPGARMAVFEAERQVLARCMAQKYGNIVLVAPSAGHVTLSNGCRVLSHHN
jgi:oxalate decarboxylase/phosphoglucose isomerase-like protein (cupin superfamily)